MKTRSLFVAAALLIVAACAVPADARTPARPSGLRLVVIVSRHGVRSPTSYTAMTPYAARRWPAWNVPPGSLTPHGALLATFLGAYYRAFYANAGLFEPTGCPNADRIYAWADTDARTQATADALLEGLAPGCGLTHHSATAAPDPIFKPVPALGKADPTLAAAALSGAIGANPNGILAAYRLPYEQLDALLDCATSNCRHISTLPASIAVSRSSGLASLRGPVEVASTAVEDLLLEYAEGLPGNEVGWGHLDRRMLLDLSQLYVLRRTLEDRNPYAARITASNLTAHVLATLNQGATGKRNSLTSAPPASRFIAFVGHDTNLAQIGGLLRLSWLVPGYQPNDTPPGGALVFELHDADPSVLQTTAFVQVFFVAQPLDAMRRATPASALVPVLRVPVYVPGCPALSCPIGTFNAVLQAAIDPAFVR